MLGLPAEIWEKQPSGLGLLGVRQQHCHLPPCHLPPCHLPPCHLPPCHLLCSKGVVVPSFSSSSSLEDPVPLDDSRWSLWLNSPVPGKHTDH